MIGIRVDGNSQIGTGHVHRCISIACSLREVGITPIFIMADYGMSELIINHGFNIVSTESEWNNMITEVVKMGNIIKNYNIDTLIVDSYNITSNYTTEVGKIVDLYYIDDFYNKQYKNLKGVISYNIGSNFSKVIYDQNVKLFLGTKYIPIREEFKNIKPINITPTVKNIIITTGGTDNYLIIESLYNIFKHEEVFKNITMHIIIGRYFINKDKLKEFSNYNKNIIVYENTNNISSIMLRSDMAISAGGTTLYELCLCGLPTVTFSIADNQLKITKALSDDKIVLYSGHYKNNVEKVLYNIKQNTLDLINNKKLREDMSSRALKVIDGNGSKRIAEEFKKLKVNK